MDMVLAQQAGAEARWASVRTFPRKPRGKKCVPTLVGRRSQVSRFLRGPFRTPSHSLGSTVGLAHPTKAHKMGRFHPHLVGPHRLPTKLRRAVG